LLAIRLDAVRLDVVNFPSIGRYIFGVTSRGGGWRNILQAMSQNADDTGWTVDEELDVPGHVVSEHRSGYPFWRQGAMLGDQIVG
jgi:hypothetical protein